ncbi:MAG: ATP-binding cassette domain-containing protein [Planctomycetes bacterium]|nr:ATP-binding cassette domain-containing protein [Planctomycetota bacterium]
MSAAVELAGVEVFAGKTRVLGPVDLAVAAGEHVTLVGPSGCGKTTLLRVVAGLARLSAGRVSLFGELVTDGARQLVAPERRGIGMLFQGGGLWPHMTARATLEFVLGRAGVPRGERRARVSELLEAVELVGFEERKPGTLSGGEAQRLGLARALAGAPRLLLLDEPLGPLDAELRRALLARIDDLQRARGLTLLHVTHDPEESEMYSTRTLHLQSGRLAEAPR